MSLTVLWCEALVHRTELNDLYSWSEQFTPRTYQHMHIHPHALLHCSCIVLVSFTCAQVHDENSNLCHSSIAIVVDIYVGVSQASNLIDSEMLSFQMLLYPILILLVYMYFPVSN